jgi:hypothetical protein
MLNNPRDESTQHDASKCPARRFPGRGHLHAASSLANLVLASKKRPSTSDEAVAKIGDALGHGDRGETATNHYVGAAATVPALRVLAGGTG